MEEIALIVLICVVPFLAEGIWAAVLARRHRKEEEEWRQACLKYLPPWRRK